VAFRKGDANGFLCDDVFGCAEHVGPTTAQDPAESKVFPLSGDSLWSLRGGQRRSRPDRKQATKRPAPDSLPDGSGRPSTEADSGCARASTIPRFRLPQTASFCGNRPISAKDQAWLPRSLPRVCCPHAGGTDGPAGHAFIRRRKRPASIRCCFAGGHAEGRKSKESRPLTRCRGLTRTALWFHVVHRWAGYVNPRR
jgi:hypothetical protein